MRSLVATKEIEVAVRAFRKRLLEAADDNSNLDWLFPNGERVTCPTYNLDTCYGRIQVGLHDDWDTRIAHLLRFVKEPGSLSSDLEINIPPMLDRRVSGLYVESDNELWLCSRGVFTSFRGRIPKNLVQAYFFKWLMDVDDGGRNATVIPVVSIDSPSLKDDIATFLHAVVSLKEEFKKNPSAGPEHFSGEDAPWSRGKEFEGTVFGNRTSTEIKYEYLHGPLCNRLQDYLKGFLSGSPLGFGKTQRVDAAIVDPGTNRAISMFEVKTAAC